MHVRIVVMGLLSLSTSAVLQADEIEELDKITVQSSSFDGETVEDFAQSVQVLHGEELERKRSDTIGETLKNELGVSSTYFAPAASRPIIRGLGSNRVRVLENGIDTLDASSISEDHAVSIEPYFAEQVEILRGPSTLRYGPGAIGGVVNVINKRIPQSLDAEPLEIDALYEHQTVSDGNTFAAELNGATDSFAWHLDGLTRNTNNYSIDGFANEEEPENEGVLSNSDIDTDSIGFGGSYITDKVLVGLAVSDIKSDYGVPGALEGDIRIDLEQTRWDSQIEFFSPFSGVDSISLRSTYNDYEHEEVEEDGEVATTFDNEELETRLEFVTSSGDVWQNAFGLQYNDRDFSAVGEEAGFVIPVDEERIGIFGITHYHNGPWDLEAGARFDTIDIDPNAGESVDFNTSTISFGAQRALGNDLQANFYIARAERAPQEVALFADGAHLATLTFETGDVNLEEETSFNVEFGLAQTKSKYSWKVNAYVNQIDDYIFLANLDSNNDGVADLVDEDGNFDPVNGELFDVAYQNADARFYGAEAEFKAQLIDDGSLLLNGRVFADFVRAEFDDDALGNVPRITPARLGFGVDGSRGDWDGFVDLIFVDDQDRPAQFDTETDGFTMLNAGLSKRFTVGDSDLKLSLRGENLLDEDARQATSFTRDRVVLPGRSINLGVLLEY